MFLNDFVLNSVTLQKAMSMQKEAEEKGYELAIAGTTFVLYDSTSDEDIRYKYPIAVGVLDVLITLAQY